MNMNMSNPAGWADDHKKAQFAGVGWVKSKTLGGDICSTNAALQRCVVGRSHRDGYVVVDGLTVTISGAIDSGLLDQEAVEIILAAGNILDQPVTAFIPAPLFHYPTPEEIAEEALQAKLKALVDALTAHGKKPTAATESALMDAVRPLLA